MRIQRHKKCSQTDVGSHLSCGTALSTFVHPTELSPRLLLQGRQNESRLNSGRLQCPGKRQEPGLAAQAHFHLQT